MSLWSAEMGIVNYAGYYLNLDRDDDRRRTVENQLAAFNLQAVYQRYPAALGNILNVHAPKLSPGAVGCFTSHYLLLKSLGDSPAHIHVVEDDVVFASCTGVVIDRFIQNGAMDNWDLLYTDIWIPVNLDIIRELGTLLNRCATFDPKSGALSVNEFALIDLKGRIFASTVSYVVNRRSVRKIADLLAGAVAGGLSQPIDLFYRQQVHEGQLKAACLFPFVTSVNVRQNLLSNISDRSDADLLRSILLSTLLRNLFFIQGNPSMLREIAEEHLRFPPLDDRARVLAAVSRFASSTSFKPY
jgi:GR25 family glycosyltransferase involved in LPS biosynthesis